MGNLENDPSIRILCRNIQRLRRRTGLSQKDMAALLQISIYSLRRLENGQLPPRLGINFLFSISRHFKMTPARLLSEPVE